MVKQSFMRITHSLIGALFIAFVAGIVGTRLWGKRNGFVIEL